MASGGGIGGALGLNKTKESSKSTTSSTSRTTGTSSLTALTDAQRGQLDAALSALMGTQLGDSAEDPRYSKEAAVADSQAMVASIFDNFSKTVLPQIFTGMNKAGAYNSTTGQLLANDAFAQANTKAAGLVLDNINAYAERNTQNRQFDSANYATNLQSLLGLFGIASGATKTEAIDQTTVGTSTTNSSGKSTSTGAAISGKFGW